MSYDKVIGFGYQGEEAPRVLSKKEITWLRRLGIPPVLHDLKPLLPRGEDKEPEPKLLLPNASAFGQIRRLIQDAPNGFMIPGQLYDKDEPLVSLLLDTKKRGFPTCEILSGNHSLRWRANMNTDTGMFIQPDFNEKSTAAVSKTIGGCLDRSEREHEFPDDLPNVSGYQGFLNKYRAKGNPAFCDDIPYEQLHVYAGYVTARTMYAFAVRHPKHDFMVVFEACEDHTVNLTQDMQITNSYKEFEFEAKQIVGDIPSFARNPESFKLLLYRFMTDVQGHIAASIPGAQINTKSKADMAREHLAAHALIDESHIAALSLSERFKEYVGYRDDNRLIAERSALYVGKSLDDTIIQERGALHHIAGRLIGEKSCEKNFVVPDIYRIGTGAQRSHAIGSSGPLLH